MLCKIRHYVNFDTLRMIYFGIFSSILMYGSLIWGHHDRIVNKLEKLQNKAVRIINFKPKRFSVASLYKDNAILKLSDSIILQDAMFVHANLNNNIPTSLSDKFAFAKTGKNTRNDLLNQLAMDRTKTIAYGSKSIKSKCIESWNFIHKHFHNIKLHEKNKLFCKELVTKFLIDHY